MNLNLVFAFITANRSRFRTILVARIRCVMKILRIRVLALSALLSGIDARFCLFDSRCGCCSRSHFIHINSLRLSSFTFIGIRRRVVLELLILILFSQIYCSLFLLNNVCCLRFYYNWVLLFLSTSENDLTLGRILMLLS